MKVFVFEHLCSGSAAGDDLSPQLTPMGGAMLQAVVEDFLAMGVDVATVLDHRINLSFGQAQVMRVTSSGQSRAAFETLSRQADATLVIAPESDGILEGWIDHLESRGCPHLNSSLAATQLCSDKLLLMACLAEAGLPTPATSQYREQTLSRFPVVIKPRRGAGSEWTFVCHDAADVQAIPPWEDWIVQPLVKGTSASCAVIVRDGQAHPLPMGLQLIEGSRRFHYRGGRLPLDSPAGRELARQAAQAVPGVSGYIGVDIILGDDPSGSEDRVIEINPRISMSYLGLRVLCEQNLLEAILGRIDPARLTWKPGAIRFNTSGDVTWENNS